MSNGSPDFFHHAGHSEGGFRGLGAAVVPGTETADAGLSLRIEEEDFMNNRNTRFHLDTGKRIGDGLADVLGMGGFAAEDYPKADNGRKRGRGLAGQVRSDDGDFESAGEANDFDPIDTSAAQNFFRRAKHGVDVTGVVARGNDSVMPAIDLRRY